MEKQLSAILREMGLSDKTVKVYVTLLVLGEGSVQEIAAHAKLKRPTVYLLLEELKKRKLVFEEKVSKRTKFIPEKPAAILTKLQTLAHTVAVHLDEFEKLCHSVSKRPRLVFFNGAEGFKKVWEVLFESGVKEFLIITDPQEMLGFVRQGYITGKIIKEKMKRGITSRQLIAFSEYAKQIVAKDKQEGRVSKVLPHTYHIPFTTLIFGDSVAFISPAGENMLLVFESPAFSKTQRSLFEALWALLP